MQGRGSGICISYLKIVVCTNVSIYLSVAVSVYRSAIALSACISKVNIKEERPHLGEVRTTNIGDLFFAKIDCYGDDNGMGVVFDGECYKYDLSLIGVTDNQITLQYREYMKPVNKYGAYKIK